MTLAKYLDGWLAGLAAGGRKPSTIHGYRVQLDRYVIDAIGGLELQAVTAAHLDVVYAELATCGLSPRTRRLVHSIVHKALHDAERKRIVAHNVAMFATPPCSRAVWRRR